MLTYKRSGVDIELANSFVSYIKKVAPSIGGFSGLFPLNLGKNENQNKYFISASSDGVGTKLKLLSNFNMHQTAGIDLVAMNVNDIICCGAKPLFFLDYFACSKLDLNISKKVINGIVDGCSQANCVLLGGETAEMPGFYKNKEYDLAGFSVGIVEKSEIIDEKKIIPGDLILGLPSSGPHSNGFSLIRKVLGEKDLNLYKNNLLKPTKIYVKTILKLKSKLKNFSSEIHGICHITGGGFYDNIVRVLPENCIAKINKTSYEVPEIFNIIQKKGKIAEMEMYRVLNMGIGLVLVVSKNSYDKIKSLLKEAIIIGEIKKGNKSVTII